jgi:site-specific DNA-methyltransferase (adenine-specific)
VIDPFVGEGTTLLAAKECNISAIGIEIEEKYCEIAVRRLQQDVFQWENNGIS